MCVNEHVEMIFLISEKYFSIKTDASKRSIGIFSLVKSVMEYKPVENAMESVIESIPEVQIEKEIVKITLHNMITLYMRVRAFSLARYIVQKEKIAKREKGKANSLRKSLKKSDEDTDKLLGYIFIDNFFIVILKLDRLAKKCMWELKTEYFFLELRKHNCF